MYFGVFGSIFLLAQFFQVTQGLSPLEAGLRTLPWTVDADVRRADRRPALRPHRLAAADGHRPGAAGDRDRLAGRGLDADRPLQRARDPVHPRRHRHGARLRADRQRGPERRPPGGGRPGLGRHQRDPRGRRHARRRRAGLGVRRQRLLRVAAGLHRRHDERGLGRRGGAGGRRADRPARARASGRATRLRWPSRPWPRRRARAPPRRWRRRRPAPGRASAPRRARSGTDGRSRRGPSGTADASSCARARSR